MAKKHQPRQRKADSTQAIAVSPDIDVTKADFPIVGIGCSAGGLEALERFFKQVNTDCSMAFVVVQHLAPTHESSLPSLLQRFTRLNVVEAQNRMTVQPGWVYVIPPAADISLLHGVLHLLDSTKRNGQNLPVDFFLRTLAQDRKEKAIGVILSGMGSDGVLGLRAIKEASGLTLAQDPASAESESMPRSAIAAGVVDITAQPEDLIGRITAYLTHPAKADCVLKAEEPTTLSDIEKIIVLLRDRTGNDFTLYKTNTLIRRLERRIALHQIHSLGDYLDYLRNNANEIDILFKEMLIGVTSFFRDREIWTHLIDEALPDLIANHQGAKPFRAWVPACSSGEEAYSLAISFREAMAKAAPDKRFDLQIYATDLDPDAIEKARKGFYPSNIAADVPPDLLTRYFTQEDGGYRLTKQLREAVVFATQNIISDPPFTKLDVLSCRNLMIYFRPQLQRTLLPLFHYALKTNGLLLLGNAETIGNFTTLFLPVSSKNRLFRKLEQPLPLVGLSFPSSAAATSDPVSGLQLNERVDGVGQLTDQLIQQTYAPAAVLVNEEGDILYISGRTGKYLEPAAGRVNMNIYAMAREGLREALAGVLRKAQRERQPIRLKGLQVSAEGMSQLVDVTVQALEKPEPLRGRLIIVFHDVPSQPGKRKATKNPADTLHNDLVQELQQTREALQATHEEMQTSMEELKSSNEELQSSNEELQSTNEELTTSKEEMQSLNEELQTVNAELQSKVEDLTWVKNDMANLLNSTEIATLFLDGKMTLRRFTPHATSVFKLIPGDVGRPFTHIVTELDYPALIDDAKGVLDTLVFKEFQAGTHDGRWYRVRIMPYRTFENVIDGVVITFTDISEIKRMQMELGKLN